MSELTDDDIQTILKIIDGLGDRNVSIELGDLKLQVTRGGEPSNFARAPAPASAPSANPAPAMSERPAATATSQAVPAPAPASAPQTAAPARDAKRKFEVPPGHVAIKAPTTGTFYRATSPGAPPFTEVGNHVEADDTVCVFDVMKLFTSLRAGVAGTVTAILVENQTVVEQNQPLILIKPD